MTKRFEHEEIAHCISLWTFVLDVCCKVCASVGVSSQSKEVFPDEVLKISSAPEQHALRRLVCSFFLFFRWVFGINFCTSWGTALKA